MWLAWRGHLKRQTTSDTGTPCLRQEIWSFVGRPVQTHVHNDTWQHRAYTVSSVASAANRMDNEVFSLRNSNNKLTSSSPTSRAKATGATWTGRTTSWFDSIIMDVSCSSVDELILYPLWHLQLTGWRSISSSMMGSYCRTPAVSHAAALTWWNWHQHRQCKIWQRSANTVDLSKDAKAHASKPRNVWLHWHVTVKIDTNVTGQGDWSNLDRANHELIWRYYNGRFLFKCWWLKPVPLDLDIIRSTAFICRNPRIWTMLAYEELSDVLVSCSAACLTFHWSLHSALLGDPYCQSLTLSMCVCVCVCLLKQINCYNFFVPW